MTGPRWTAAQIAENLKYDNGRRAFNTPATARSWIARMRKAGKLEHVGTTGPRDARLYDAETVVQLWRMSGGRVTTVSDKTREIERELDHRTERSNHDRRRDRLGSEAVERYRRANPMGPSSW